MVPDRPCAVCRELTKRHEQVERGTVAELAKRFGEPVRGEVTIVLGAAPPAEADEEGASAAVAELVAALTDAGLPAAGLSDDGDAIPAVAVVPASLVKGLEFDAVVVVDPAAIVAAEPHGLHRLYVVLTRAVSTLVVLHRGDLPAPLAL